MFQSQTVRGLRLALAVVLLCASTAQGQSAGLAGQWHLKRGKGMPSTEVLIAQTPQELTLQENGESLAFQLNGATRTQLDASVEYVPNFIRRIETLVRRDGSTLILEATDTLEQIDPGHSTTTIGMTRLTKLKLSGDGKQLTVERARYFRDRLVPGRSRERKNIPESGPFKSVYVRSQ